MKKPNFDTTKLKKQVEENPALFAGIAVVSLQAVAKLMNANTQRKNSNTYRREVARREKNSR